MQSKKFQFRGYLIHSLMIGLILGVSITNTNAREAHVSTHSNIQDLSGEGKTEQDQTTLYKLPQQYEHDIRVDHPLVSSNGIEEAKMELKVIKSF